MLIFAIFSKNKKRKARAFITATILLFVFTNSFILNEVMLKWEIPAIKNEVLEKHTIGIVLGGMTFYDRTFERIHFHQGSDRLLQAIDLYKRGKIKKIFISGGSGSMVYKDKEAIYLKSYLLTLEIPESDILIESESKNTRENALFTAETLKKIYPKGTGTSLLITSGFHMRRSLLCFEKAGLKVSPYSTDRYSGKRVFYFDHLFIPNTQTLVGWDVLIHELVGFVTYKIAGYI